jgi:hypothetical protein
MQPSTHDQEVCELAQWVPADPPQATAWFAGVRTRWWIAGGWAIDLFLQQQTRTHLDLDVGVLRRDVTGILPALKTWEIFEAKNGTLTRLATGAVPSCTVNSLWCRQSSNGPWTMELMLDDSDGENWVYRREQGVRRNLNDVVRAGADGILYLVPEIQLLYKSKTVRSKDDADFQMAMPRLCVEARRWLRQSILRTSPSHYWINQIERCGEL